MMTIQHKDYEKHARCVEWLDCEIVNGKIEKGWSAERLFTWMIKQIANSEGIDWTYDEAMELKELVLVSNNYRI